MIYRKTLNIPTPEHDCMLNLTGEIQSVVGESGIKDGFCFLFNPHTTAGLTINEQADPDVVQDILRKMGEVIPWRDRYAHGEGNSAAHIKTSLFGPSLTIMIEEGRLLLGTWQGIFFCEFDGPRRRRLEIKLVSD